MGLASEVLRNPKVLLLNKNIRDKLVLTILIIVLLCVIGIQYALSPSRPPRGAERILMCPECGQYEKQRITQLEDNLCPVCDKQLGYAWKCRDCDFEFPVVLLPLKGTFTKKELDAYVTGIKSCPNCKSENTGALSVTKGDKAK